MTCRASHANITFRAGSAALLSRLALALLCIYITLTPPTLPLSQAQSPAQNESEEVLIAALLKAGKEGQAIESLLDQHGALITPRLWNKLTSRALSAYCTAGSEQSLLLYGIALNVAERLKDQRLVAATHYRIGRTYSGLGQTQSAIQSLLESRKIFEAAELRRDLIYVLGDLASLYYYAEDFKPARLHAEESILSTGPDS